MNENKITYFTDVSLITCVVQAGLSEVIFKAARDVGATAGSISHHARGIGMRERLGILGVAVEAEKEVVSILVSSEQKDFVYDTICRAANLEIPGRGYIYVTPLEKASAYMPKSMLDQLETDEESA